MIKNDVRRDMGVGAKPVTSGFKVDINRGERIGRVSSEWFRRPDDGRYLSLTELHAAVRTLADGSGGGRDGDRATARTVETKALQVEARTNDISRLSLAIPGCPELIAPTHWSFDQLCGLVGAPASYLRQLPAPLAGINLQHGLSSHRAELVKTLEADDGRIERRAVIGLDYRSCADLRPAWSSCDDHAGSPSAAARPGGSGRDCGSCWSPSRSRR